MNNVTLIGNLCSDVTLRDAGEQKVASFKLAVNRPGKDKGADFIWVSTWNGSAEACAQYLGKGHEVAVVGSIRTDYDRENQKDYVKVNAQRVTFLRRPNHSTAPPVSEDEAPQTVEVSTEPPSSDDIPF